MAQLGRRPQALETPVTPLQRFAWLVRTNRLYHTDAAVRSVGTFTASLRTHSKKTLAVDSVNKLERGSLQFSVNLALAYEKALGLVPWTLADNYIYACRLEGVDPRWARAPQADSAPELDLLHRIAGGEVLQAYELLELCAGLRKRHPEFLASRRWFETISQAVLDLFGMSFERDERLLRECLILLGEQAVPFIRDYARASRIHHFNAIEALGFIESDSSWKALIGFASTERDPISTQTVLEPIRRWIRKDPSRAELLRVSAPDLPMQLASDLADTRHAFTAREEILALLGLSGSFRQSRLPHDLNEIRSDLQQLSLQFPRDIRRDYLSEIVSRIETSTPKNRGLRVKAPLQLPGLQKVLEEGIFGVERVSRLSVASLLAVLPNIEQVGQAIGVTLVRSSQAQDYGAQRSLVRLLTKSQSKAGILAISQFADRRIADEGLMLATAWALGMSSQDQDQASLQRLYASGSGVTRQVARLSWERRKFTGDLTVPT